jgi:glycosyltransferase involved in cell wall biosynthesis
MRIGVDARLAGVGLGVSRLIQALGTLLPESGDEVVWIGAEATAPSAVSEVAAPPRPGFAALDSPLGRRLARARRIELMHFAANTGWWTAGPERYVLTVHDVIWSRSSPRGQSPRQRLGHAYLRLVVPRALLGASAVLTPSVAAAEDLRRRYGARAEVIPNAVADVWRSGPARRDGAGGGQYLVGFAGRDERKATDVTLDAWSRVEGAGVGLKLLTGAGLPPGLQARVAALRAAGRIDVLPYLDEGELVREVAGALALLYPSRDEGFGLPVAEALAAGTPVITGLAPVTLEVGGDAVLRLDPRDPAASGAAHVLALLGDTGLRAELAARGRRRTDSMRWEAVVSAYRRRYEQILGA